MANSNQQRSQVINTVYDFRRNCSICSVLRRFFSSRPCNRSSDSKIINWVVVVSLAILTLVSYASIHTAIFLSDKTLELARLQRQEKAVEAILSMNLKELSQVNLNDPKWMN